MKKLFKEHSAYLLVFTLIESVLAVITTMSFVYTDRLSYQDSIIFKELGIEKLLENMYSSTWWALILLLICFAALFAITSINFKKLEYLFLSIGCWIILFILSINVNNGAKDIFSNIALFVPILIINIICYRTEKNKLNLYQNKKSHK